MGVMKGPTEGGSGGGRGHSNMDHWAETAEVKEAARIRRRLDARAEIGQQMADHADSGNTATEDPEKMR